MSTCAPSAPGAVGKASGNVKDSVNRLVFAFQSTRASRGAANAAVLPSTVTRVK
ncbi:hypothetical protein D3C71_1927010 [compost metagenome]